MITRHHAASLSKQKHHQRQLTIHSSGAKLQADIITYNTLMNCFQKSACWEAAVSCLQSAEACDLELTTVSYTTVITALRRSSQCPSFNCDAVARDTHQFNRFKHRFDGGGTLLGLSVSYLD